MSSLRRISATSIRSGMWMTYSSGFASPRARATACSRPRRMLSASSDMTGGLLNRLNKDFSKLTKAVDLGLRQIGLGVLGESGQEEDRVLATVIEVDHP